MHRIFNNIILAILLISFPHLYGQESLFYTIDEICSEISQNLLKDEKENVLVFSENRVDEDQNFFFLLFEDEISMLLLMKGLSIQESSNIQFLLNKIPDIHSIEELYKFNVDAVILLSSDSVYSENKEIRVIDTFNGQILQSFLLKNSDNLKPNDPEFEFMTEVYSEVLKRKSRELSKPIRIKKIKERRKKFKEGNKFHIRNIGFNYNLFENTVNSNWGVFILGNPGFFISGYNRKNPIRPSYFYSVRSTARLEEELNLPIDKRLSFISTEADFHTFNTGIYLPINTPYNSLTYSDKGEEVVSVYFILGVSSIFGSSWEIYDGDIPNLPVSYESGRFALNKQEFNVMNIISGISLVFPYFQIETGYNNLYKQLFLNVGLNMPLNKL